MTNYQYTIALMVFLVAYAVFEVNLHPLITPRRPNLCPGTLEHSAQEVLPLQMDCVPHVLVGLSHHRSGRNSILRLGRGCPVPAGRV